MPLIFTSIFRRLLFSTALLTTVIVIAVWLTQSLRFLDMIVNRSVSLKGYFFLISFLIPDLLVVILPICFFISVVFFYNKFFQDRELVIWRSAGLSNFNLSLPALFLSCIVVMITFIINVFILPPSFKYFKETQHLIQQQLSGAMLQDGKFNESKGATIYIKQRYRSGHMRGILIHHTQSKTPYTIFAKEGKILQDQGHFYMELKDGYRQERDIKTQHLQTLRFSLLKYDLSSLMSSTSSRTERPYEKSITELLSPTEKSLPPETRARYTAAAHQRLLHPFFPLVYAVIGLACLLKSPFRRKGQHLFVSLAFIIGFLFHITVTALINAHGNFAPGLFLAYALAIGIPLILIVYAFDGLSFLFKRRSSFNITFPSKESS